MHRNRGHRTPPPFRILPKLAPHNLSGIKKVLETARLIPGHTDQYAIRLSYTYSSLGRDLFEAGHVTGGREITMDDADPFKWPTPWRDLATTGLGASFDDCAAFPTIRCAMVPCGQLITKQFLQWRKEIMSQAGKWLCPNVPEPIQYARMKGITNAFDMDSGLDAWRSHKWAAGDKRSLAECTITLPDASTFNFANYRAAQSSVTTWMQSHATSLIEFIQSSRLHPSSAKWRKAKLTAKSYILQEAEATARCAKISALTKAGIPIHNLQHDGIIAGTPRDSVQEWATRLSKIASGRCKLPVVVKGEWV